MDDIVLERGSANVMKLDDDEQALFDEIQVEPTRVKRAKAPKMNRPIPRSQPEPEIDLNAFTNPNKQTAPPRPPPAETFDYGEQDDDDGYEQDHDMGGAGGGMNMEEQPSDGYTSIDDEKADLLNKLMRLSKKGFTVNQRLNAYSNIQEIRTEYKRIMYGIEVDQSVKFSRRMMVACVSGLEFLNKRYNPVDIHLDGWSESVMENLDDYDGIFEELYVKYKTKMNVAPEVKLIMMLGGSAMMFHLTNSMFKAAIPNMSDVMKQNPELVKSMVQAVQNTRSNQPAQTMEQQSKTDASGRREMKGPGFDISSLMGGIMMPPPPPMNTSLPVVREIQEEDDISDIVSVSGDSTGGEVRDVNLKSSGKKKGLRKKKNEVTM
jgi:hypothetical protein